MYLIRGSVGERKLNFYLSAGGLKKKKKNVDDVVACHYIERTVYHEDNDNINSNSNKRRELRHLKLRTTRTMMHRK